MKLADANINAVAPYEVTTCNTTQTPCLSAAHSQQHKQEHDWPDEASCK